MLGWGWAMSVAPQSSEGSGRVLRPAASAGMIAFAVIAGAFVRSGWAGLSPIGQDPFEQSIPAEPLMIAAHLVLAAAVPVHRWPHQVLVFGAALAAMHWPLTLLFAAGAALPALAWLLYCGLTQPGERRGWRRWAARPHASVELVIAICGTATALGL